MKKITILLASLLLGTSSFAQTTLFSDDFESGSGQWTLNASGSGGNEWVVNNVYLGGLFGLIADTPNQPAGITNNPQSTYLHVTNNAICTAGICNANYDASSTSDYYTQIAAPINASAATNVTLSFWYLCAGLTGTAFGTLEYSVDGGATWVATGTSYVNTGSWTQETVSLPAWDNVAALSFRFRWENTNSASGSDPSFSVDDILVEGTTSGGSNTITTGTSLSPSTWCVGNPTTIMVDFTSTGTFNSGNVYSAELSDATGSFAAPTTIGTLASTANSGTITSIVPGATPAGTGYRIRVVSDNPAVTGTDNGTDLVIEALPTPTLQPFADVCSTSSPVALSGGNPSGGSYSGPGVSGGNFDPSVAGLGTHTITYTYTTAGGCTGTATETITVTNGATVTQAPFSDVCSTGGVVTLIGGSPSGGTYSGSGVSGTQFDPSTTGLGTFPITYTYSDPSGCTGSATEDITVIQGPTVTLAAFGNVCDTDPFFTLTGGNPSNGTYSGTGVTGGVFDPAAAGIGVHTITYTFTDGNGCDGTAFETITVNDCANLNEQSLISFELSPNPTNNTFHIVSQTSIDRVMLLDMSGRVIKEFDGSNNVYSVQEIPSGIYMVRVEAEGITQDQRLMKQ